MPLGLLTRKVWAPSTQLHNRHVPYTQWLLIIRTLYSTSHVTRTGSSNFPGARTYVTPGREHCKCMASLYKHMGDTQSAISLTLRCESKFCLVKFLELVHSACSYENRGLRCSPPFFFFYLVYSLRFVHRNGTGSTDSNVRSA